MGGGIAGLTAAHAAAAAGARVIVADENPVFGGVADLTAGSIDGICAKDHADGLSARSPAWTMCMC